MVWSVVTTGMRSSRSSGRRWLPALPPKIPYSCWTEMTSTALTLRKSAARVYAGGRLSAGRKGRGGVVVGELETDARRIGVLVPAVVHGQDEAVEIGADAGDGVAQVGGERGDAALARQVIAENGDAANAAVVPHGQAAFPARRGGSSRCQRGMTSAAMTNSNTLLSRRSRRTFPARGAEPVARTVSYSISRTHCRSTEADR